MKSFLEPKGVMTALTDISKLSVRAKRFKQVYGHGVTKSPLTPGYEPRQQLTDALPFSETSLVALHEGGKRGLWREYEGDDCYEEDDRWQGSGGECDPCLDVAQLLQSLEAHLSLLAHPVYPTPKNPY